MMSSENGDNYDIHWIDGEGHFVQNLDVDDAVSLDFMSGVSGSFSRGTTPSQLSSIINLDSSLDESWAGTDQSLPSSVGSQYSSIETLSDGNMDDLVAPGSPVSVSSTSTIHYQVPSPRSQDNNDPDDNENNDQVEHEPNDGEDEHRSNEGEDEHRSNDDEDERRSNHEDAPPVQAEIIHLVEDGGDEIPPQLDVPSLEQPTCSGELDIATTAGVKRPADFDNDEDDGQTCMICMEVWSNSGEHRLTSLRCGHLFGYSCIVRWLQVTRNKPLKRCPQCNKTAAIKDVRILYARKLIALDTIERDNIKKRLTEVERERNRLELELKKSELQTQLQDRQLADLRMKLAEMQSAQVRGYGINHPPAAVLAQGNRTGDVNLVLEHSVEICKEGGCRVLAYKESLNLVVVSQKSANQLFSGYGISKMNALNFRPTQFVFLHTKPIRDLAFHTSDNDLLLSVSFDRCAKLLDISSNNVVQSFLTDSPLWSCNWDINNSNIFYVGTANGIVLEYDMRQTGGAISRVECDDKTPVTGLVPMPANPGGALPRGGFVSCHLNSCWAYDKGRFREEYTGKQLPLEGPFFSMRYDRTTDHFLVSSRPSTTSLRVRHTVCELDQDATANALTCNQVQVFKGSTSQTILSRPCQMTIKGYGGVVASHVESSNSIAVWNMANSARVCNQPAREPILDICPIYVNDKQYLGTISEKMFRAYRVTY